MTPAPKPPVAVVCRWSAGFFLAPPDRAALALYREPAGETLLAALETEPALAAPLRDLRGMIAPGADLAAAADRLATAHSGAFLIGGHRSAPPYASVWLSPRGLLYQEPAREMNRLLAAVDLGLPDDVSEPHDHLSFQLNLLAELEEREQGGAALPVPPQVFLRDQILSWLPDFAAACKGLREPFFYAGLASALTEYLLEKSMETEGVTGPFT
jgi:TorA-specific chaperone